VPHFPPYKPLKSVIWKNLHNSAFNVVQQYKLSESQKENILIASKIVILEIEGINPAVHCIMNRE
jgi:hypothetical protein